MGVPLGVKMCVPVGVLGGIPLIPHMGVPMGVLGGIPLFPHMGDPMDVPLGFLMGIMPQKRHCVAQASSDIDQVCRIRKEQNRVL